MVFFCNLIVLIFSKKYIKSLEEVPESEAVLILGAKVYQNGNLSDILRDRVDTAIELYKNKKVNVFLVSGDHTKNNYDEVNSIKEYLLEKGIADEKIFLDHAGIDTYDSLYRAKTIFEINSLIVTTQNFHLPRAVFIGNKLGIKTYGVSADKRHYLYATRNEVRESLGRIKAVVNILIHSKPKFLGEKIPITGDSRKSWDE